MSSKYTLTINTDDLQEVLQCLTSVSVAEGHEELPISKQGQNTEEATRCEDCREEVAVKPAKRGRKPKVLAEVEEVQEPVAEQQPEQKMEVPAEEKALEKDLEDVLAGEEDVTKQDVTDAAIEVGRKLGRDVMVAAITKFATTGKLSSVDEAQFPRLYALLQNASSCDEKKDAKALIEGFKV